MTGALASLAALTVHSLFLYFVIIVHHCPLVAERDIVEGLRLPDLAEIML